jgi:hypothetical protein
MDADTQARHYAIIEAYYDAAGNKAEAALAMGLKKTTYASRLKAATKALEIDLKPVAHGSRTGQSIVKMPLPKKGHFHTYFFTTIQNNTEMHPGFHNVEAYCDFFNSLSNHTASIHAATCSYNKAAYGSKAIKLNSGKASDTDDVWYAPYLTKYISDGLMEIAPALVFCGNFNIIPTARYPLTGLDAYMGRKSIIVPHVKMAQKPVASMPEEAAKQMFSTGACTMKNYIQKRAGNLAEAEHDFGCFMVTVDYKGNWHPRFLEIAEDDSVQDIGPAPFKGIHVQAGLVFERNVVAGINWGDVHGIEMDPGIANMNWGPDGILDTLSPEAQTMNDLYSHRFRSHHELKNPMKMYEKYLLGEDSVEQEVTFTAGILNSASRPWCTTYIIGSNHDRHLDQWLDDTDIRWDPSNWRYGSFLNYNRLHAREIDRNFKFNTLEFALRDKQPDMENVVFLEEDQSLLIQNVEHGLHGDRGPNGARGSTRNLTKLGRKVNKGHDHQAGRELGVMSAGACAMTFPYMKGPGSHSVAHTITYLNGARTNIMIWAGTWRF